MALSMMQTMALYDDNGRCRCPYCGKFRTVTDFPDQSGHHTFGDNNSHVVGHIHTPPACVSCLTQDNVKA